MQAEKGKTHSSTMLDLMPGEVTPRFEPNKEHFDCRQFLGEGTYGLSKLWIADHKPSGAIVLLRKTKLDKLEYDDLENFQYEMQLSSQLQHPSILSYHCSFVESREIWTVFPFFDYGSCSDIIQAGFPNGLQETAVLYILRSVLQGVHYLHTAGYIHRAIKASHVLLCSDGNVCLSGLRYCYPMWSNSHRLKVVHNFPAHAVAVLPWTAPEVLDQLATGKIPFSGLSPTEIFLQKLHGSLPSSLDCSISRRKSTEPSNSVSDLNFPEKERKPASPLRLRSMSTPQGMSRRFDTSLQQFVELCLDRNPSQRPTAANLLSSSFLRQQDSVARKNNGKECMQNTIVEDKEPLYKMSLKSAKAL
eukprot:gene13983-4947_t